MKCTNCGIPLKPHYSFCPNCGMGLSPRRRGGGGALVMVLLVAAICACVIYVKKNGGLDAIFFKNAKPSPDGRRNSNDRDSGPGRGALLPVFETAPAPSVAGCQVLLSDVAGNQTARITGVVSAGGWIAMPREACVGARDWRFQIQHAGIIPISFGMLEDGDDVGLWQTETVSAFSSPAIYPARLDRPLTWISLASRETAAFSGFTLQSEQMNVFGVSLPPSISEPGVFVQNGRMVGWTFGDLAEMGYLWKGPGEDNLVAELTVADFYRRTFEGGREERMILAQAMDDSDPVARLAAFADGFRLAPMLSEEKTPPHLRTHALVAEMRALISELLEENNAQWLQTVFDGPALTGTGDGAFVLDVLKTMAQVEGPARPLVIIDEIMTRSEGLDGNALERLQAFQNELNRAAATNDNKGLVIRFSPDTGQIRTRAVLNRRIDQDFVVDTGATMVTIPSSAAKALGLEIRFDRRRKIMTAGGMIEAPEVMLDAVALEGWVESNVTAYVVDLPGQRGMGLLGLNYLNRFHLNINTAAGELTLEPRSSDEEKSEVMK